MAASGLYVEDVMASVLAKLVGGEGGGEDDKVEKAEAGVVGAGVIVASVVAVVEVADEGALELTEEENELERAKAQASGRSRTHTVGHRQAASLIESIAPAPEAEGDLHATEIDGESFLVERQSGKVYSDNDDQTFVGKLTPAGNLDRA